jgi:alpha-1,6-mannosyltransferase
MPSFLQHDHRFHVELVALLLLTAVVVLCEMIAVGTKVEESFNMQAIHDILFSPTIEGFDHLQFSGVVPRSFAGALVVAGIVAPLAAFFPRHGDDAVVIAHAARIVLGLLFVGSCWFAGRCLNDVVPSVLGWRTHVAAEEDKSQVTTNPNTSKKGEVSNSSDDDDEETEEERLRVVRMASRPTFSFPILTPCSWFLLITAGVFHIVYYASRTLPNSFALILLNVSLGYLVQPSKQYHGLAVLGATATIFRGDVFVLVAPLGLILAITQRIHFFRGLLVGAVSVLVALVVTVPIDSYMWQMPFCRFWPEGVVLLFNTVENQSHLWGTQPWHWYFSYALPRCFLGVLPFILWAVVAVAPLRHLSLATFLFIGLYSVLPHKEVRFVLIVFPWLVAPLAVMLARNARPAPPATAKNQSSGIERVWRHSQRTTREHVRAAGMVAYLLLHVAAAVGSAWISSHNYPGAAALATVHRRLDHLNTTSSDRVFTSQHGVAVVQLDAYAAMTGISRFSKKHYRPSVLLKAGLSTAASSTGAAERSTKHSGTTGIIVGYNKNPKWFNASREGGSSSDAAVPTSRRLNDYHNGFSVMIRRAEESFLHTRAGVYVQKDSVDSMERFDFRKLRIATTRFLTIWEQPHWRKRQQKEQQQQQQHQRRT